jgi:hypothetical protein
MSSNAANASAEARKSCRPNPTLARNSSDDTISAGSKLAAAHVDFPDPDGPTSTTTQGAASAMVMSRR